MDYFSHPQNAFVCDASIMPHVVYPGDRTWSYPSAGMHCPIPTVCAGAGSFPVITRAYAYRSGPMEFMSDQYGNGRAMPGAWLGQTGHRYGYYCGSAGPACDVRVGPSEAGGTDIVESPLETLTGSNLDSLPGDIAKGDYVKIGKRPWESREWDFFSYTDTKQNTVRIHDLVDPNTNFVEQLADRIWESGREDWKVVRREKIPLSDYQWNVFLSKEFSRLDGKYHMMSTHDLQNISSVDIVVHSDFLYKMTTRTRYP